ncbi:MAG: DUF624 domain-containing protein [Oscillospiraceae bacterium]|nr:DUF624 domain-containing protein [Oscillospiraceae bacterium]
MKLFQSDSPWIRLIDNMGNLVLLNLMFLLCCLPVVTAPAAVTALYSCTLCMARREKLELSRFWQVWKREFVVSLKAGGLIFALAALLALDGYYLKLNPAAPAFLRYGLYVLAFFAGCLALYLFPLIARFTNTIPQYVRLSLALALRYLPKTLLMMLAVCLPALLFLWNAELALRLMIFWLLFGFALTAFFNSGLLRGIFAALEETAPAADGDGPQEPEE